YIPDSTHISFRFPEWIIQSEKYKFLNPGIPEVREYVKEVVLEVVKNYDIDGIHFDDYFYPYSGITNEDENTFKMYSRGFLNIEDWRRDNVNIFVRDMYNSIKQIKPYVKFGITPFGIWKDGVPDGISGFSSYHTIYCDAVYWLQEKIVDYIVPQIYWRIGGKQDYIKLAKWWTEQLNSRHVYVGHALYKMDREKDQWMASDISDQIRFNQQNQQIGGSIYFRSSDIKNNLNGIADSLEQKYYKYPALIPQMTWIDSISPLLFPFNLIALPSPNGTFLRWENPIFFDAADKVQYNVVYRFNSDSAIDVNNAHSVLSILPASQSFYVDTTGFPGLEYNYLVTALDRLHNEGEVSNTVTFKFSQLEIYNDLATENNLFHSDSIITDNKTRIKFSLVNQEIVNLSLFDQNGEKIYNLLNEELMPGTYGVLVILDKLHYSKYYYKLTTPTFSEMKTFIKGKFIRDIKR
ncbi:MAG: family 10 glycosylhydrolase, partial [Calditrichia bacterium]|nr:family 10 glycosylhydrolase [Calditrichia bacterium]